VSTAQTPKQPARTAVASLLSSLQSSGFIVTILALLVAGVVILAPSLRILAEQQQEIAQLRAELEQTQQEVFDLEEQRERWKDPSFVETQARERLMFVYPGDITYLVIDDLEDDGEDDADTVISPTIVAAETDWREALLASYLVAATTSRAPVVQDEAVPEGIPSPEDTTGDSTGDSNEPGDISGEPAQ
jgi:cell division protein FtsB